jgi:hypothetical protein
MTQTQDHQLAIPSLQHAIIEETVDEWQSTIEDPEEDEDQSFAGALLGWYETQLLELHDSRGDADYQQDIIKLLRAFPEMIKQIKETEFGFETLEEEIRVETLPEEEYSERLRKQMEQRG